MLQAYLRRLGCSRVARDELVMDVLVDAIAVAQQAGARSSEAQVIRELARRASTNYKRIMRHEVLSNEMNQPPEGITRLEQTSPGREELWLWLEQLLQQLPQRQRAAIERHLDQQPDSVIALELNCGVDSVRVLRGRGMRTLRRLAADSPPPVEV